MNLLEEVVAVLIVAGHAVQLVRVDARAHVVLIVRRYVLTVA